MPSVKGIVFSLDIQASVDLFFTMHECVRLESVVNCTDLRRRAVRLMKLTLITSCAGRTERVHLCARISLECVNGALMAVLVCRSVC